MSQNKKAKYQPHPYRNSFVDCIALDIYETVYGQTSRFIAAGLLEIQLEILTRKSNSKIQIEILTRKSNSNSYLENPARNLTRNPNSEVSLFVSNSLPLRIVLLQKKKSLTVCPRIRGTQRRFPPKRIEKSFYAIQSTFRSLEMYSRQRYKICICSVILGELRAFRNYKGFTVIFPKIFDAVERFTNSVRIFLVLLSIAFLNPKIFLFL